MEEKKYPLDDEGVDEKFKNLYQKNDASIEVEAQFVEQDFFSWTASTFELRADQVIYMHSLGDAFAIDNGKLVAYAIRNRLAVTFIKGDPPQRSSKFVRNKSQVSVTSTPDEVAIVRVRSSISSVKRGLCLPNHK